MTADAQNSQILFPLFLPRACMQWKTTIPRVRHGPKSLTQTGAKQCNAKQSKAKAGAQVQIKSERCVAFATDGARITLTVLGRYELLRQKHATKIFLEILKARFQEKLKSQNKNLELLSGKAKPNELAIRLAVGLQYTHIRVGVTSHHKGTNVSPIPLAILSNRRNPFMSKA